MRTEELWSELKKQIASEAVAAFREALSHEVLVGPFNDDGVALPGNEQGEGFAIFIGEWRIGWFPTRPLACDAADRIADAIRQHPIKR
jgi:hypothetical protein